MEGRGVVCGRFVMVSDLAEIEELCAVEGKGFENRKSYNIAPGSMITAVLHTDARKLATLHWGLAPVWSGKGKSVRPIINARAETVARKLSFREAFRKRRCLVVADGYYEWKGGAGSKIPYFIRLKSKKPFGFAAIYDPSIVSEAVTTTCAIITTASNSLTASIHHRMPVIISPSFYDEWLDPAQTRESRLLELLRPYRANEMEAYEVSTLVNSPQNDIPKCIQPVSSHSLCAEESSSRI